MISSGWQLSLISLPRAIAAPTVPFWHLLDLLDLWDLQLVLLFLLLQLESRPISLPWSLPGAWPYSASALFVSWVLGTVLLLRYLALNFNLSFLKRTNFSLNLFFFLDYIINVQYDIVLDLLRALFDFLIALLFDPVLNVMCHHMIRQLLFTNKLLTFIAFYQASTPGPLKD